MVFDFDATNVEVKSAGRFEPMPDGQYDFEITDATEKLSAKGFPQVVVTLTVIDSIKYAGRTLKNHYVTFMPDGKGAGIAINFVKCIGEPWQGKIKIDARRWIGKRIRGKVVTEEYTSKEGDRRKKNAVQYVYKYEGISVPAEKKDEVPF